MTEQLKPLPCPFCGGAPRSVARPDNIDGTRSFYALACYCGGYSACAHKMAVEPTPEQAKRTAIEAWNRRAQPAQAGQADTRICTCHPDDNPPVPCPRKFSLTECKQSQAGQVLTDAEIDEFMSDHGDLGGDISRERWIAAGRAIEQAVLARRVPQWLPINTAPKDEAVLGYWPDGYYERVVMSDDGECEVYHILHDGEQRADNPSHWTPLPPPPGIVGEKGGA